jgi:hypothetical protein
MATTLLRLLMSPADRRRRLHSLQNDVVALFCLASNFLENLWRLEPTKGVLKGGWKMSSLSGIV